MTDDEVAPSLMPTEPLELRGMKAGTSDNDHGPFRAASSVVPADLADSSSIVVPAGDIVDCPLPRPTERRDVVFATVSTDEGEPLELRADVLTPARPDAAADLLPAVIFVPGGGFVLSPKSGALIRRTAIAQQGFVVVSIEYRTLRQGTYRDGVADVAAAVMWVAEHADDLGIDPDRIALWGESAGGYLSAMAVTTGAVAAASGDVRSGGVRTGDVRSGGVRTGDVGSGGVRTGDVRSGGVRTGDVRTGDVRTGDVRTGDVRSGDVRSGGVRCVVDVFGLTDLSQVAMDFDDDERARHLTPEITEAQYIFGRRSGLKILDDPDEVQRANPVGQVTGAEPPFLLFHGEIDGLVSPGQTQLLHQALLAAGVASTRYVVDGAGHYGIEWCSDAVLDRIAEFLREHLG